MDAAFSAEQDEIRRTLRELVTKRCGPDDVKAAVRTPRGYNPALWSALAEQLGLPGLALPEAYGGVGCTAAELALGCEELGRALAPSPLLATAVLAAPLILALGTEEQRAAHLPRIAAGELTAALAVPGTGLTTALGLVGDNAGDWSGGGRAGGVQATAEGGAWRLYGQAEQVLDGAQRGAPRRRRARGRLRPLPYPPLPGARGRDRHGADAADLARRDGARPGARRTAGRAGRVVGGRRGRRAGCARRRRGRRRHRARRRGRRGRGPRAGEDRRVRARRRAVRAGDRVLPGRQAPPRGGVRTGAGGPVGRVLRGLGRPGAQAAGVRRAGRRAGGALALAQGLDALRTAASEAVQLHGGIGFTWEHEAHLYFKRASGDELLFGPAHRLRARAAERAGLFAGDALREAV